MTDIDEEEWTVASDATIPETHLVGMAANGVDQWLVMKQDAAGLLDADYVRGLIAKSEPETQETVTMSGSPAAIAALIHGAPVRKAAPEPVAPQVDEVEKADMSAAALNNLPDSAFAVVEPGGKKDASGKTVPRSLRHYAIHDKAHASNALGRAGAQINSGDADGKRIARDALPKIRAAAKRFGVDVSKAEQAAPETNEVSKDMAIDGSAGMPLDDGMDGMDPTVVLACPEEDAPGDPNDPGSPAWESIDAATALKWTAISARLRTALGVMSDREALEAATADPSDAENAMDLDDAAAAIDFVIQTLAPFAANEQAEADDGAMDMGILGKAMGAVDTAHLETVESLGAIRKSGRALSSSNEAKLRAALTALQQILASLPKAPGAPTPATDGAAMMKEADSMAETDTARDEINSQSPLGTPKEPASAETPAAMGEPGVVAKTAETAGPETEAAPTEVTKAHEPVVDEFDVFAKRLAEVLAVPIPARFRRQEQEAEPLAKAAETPTEPTATADPAPAGVAKSETADLAKAEKTPQVAIYDAKGNLVGTVDPTEITMLAPAKAPEAPAETEAAPEAPAAPAAETPAAPPTDLTPAPAASVGTPADAVPAPSDDTVAKATDTPEDPQDMLKSSIAELVKAAIDEHSAAQAEIVKTLENQNATLEERNAALAKQAASLEERLSNIEQQDAHPRVFANGMLPPKNMLRGQDAGAPTGLSEAQSLRKQLAEATDIGTQEAISERMRQLAVQEYQDMRQRGAAI
jgi:hypothetical protein